MARRDRSLRRSTEDKKIAGVCAGLAEYFDVDTTLMRVGFVVLALIGGGGIFAYALLWVVLDPAPPPAIDAGTDQTVIPPAAGSPESLPEQPDTARDDPPTGER